LIGVGVGFLGFVLIALLVIVQVALRVRQNESRQREEEERRRRDDDAWKQREEDDRRRREEDDRRRQEEAQRQQMAAAAAHAAAVAAPAPVPALPPAAFRLHAKTAGYPDVALPDGATIIGGDAQEVQTALAGLPPGTFGYPVILSASTVSGKHAVVRVVQGAVTITDFGSTNGTFVNGVRIKANSIVELSAGDQVDLSKNVVYVLEPIARPAVR
jgi:hypothetical protein